MGKNKKKGGQSKKKIQDDGNNQPPQDPTRMGEEHDDQKSQHRRTIGESSSKSQNVEKFKSGGGSVQQPSAEEPPKEHMSGVRDFPKRDHQSIKEEQRGPERKQEYQERRHEPSRDASNTQPSGVWGKRQQAYKSSDAKIIPRDQNQRRSTEAYRDNTQQQKHFTGEKPHKVGASYSQNPPQSSRANRQQHQQGSSGESVWGKNPQKAEAGYKQRAPLDNRQQSGEGVWRTNPRQYEDNSQSSGTVWGTRQQHQKTSGESLQKVVEASLNQNQPPSCDAKQQPSAWSRSQQKPVWGNKPPEEKKGQVAPSTVQSSLINVAAKDGDKPSGQKSKEKALSKKSDEKIICVPGKMFAPGTLGRKIQLSTNHFEIFFGKVKTVIQYDVAFEPDRPKRLLKEAYSEFRKSYFPNYNPAFDGGKFVFSVKELPFGHSLSETVTVTKDLTRPMDFRVTMTKTKVVDLEPLIKYTQNKHERVELTMASIQALDIILGHTMWMQNIKVGACYFTQPLPQHFNRPQQKNFDLGSGMELYKGCFQSVSLGSKLFLNVDVANKAFPKEQDVIKLIGELSRNVNFKQPLDGWTCQALDKYIQNLKIEFCLPNKPSSKRHYTVNRIHGTASSTTFNYESQPGQIRIVTVEEYFKLVHSTTLKYPQMPCLWVGPKNKTIYLPCELCTIRPNQVIANKLDPSQTSKMIKHCATDANTRKKSIMSCLNAAHYNNDPVINEFDLSVSDDFKKLEGRVLNAPELLYKNGRIQASKGVWRTKEFLVPARIKSWTILSLDYEVQNKHMEELARALVTGSHLVGMDMGQPVRPFEEVRINQLMQALEKNKKIGIVFVVIANKVYQQVKQQAEQAVGCLTQCLTKFTVLKKLNPSTISNILLKVNAKCGGINHVLSKPPPVMKEPMMVMGADVTHPSPHSMEPSVAAVTASHDLAASKYNISCRIQKPTLEIIYDLENMTREHLLYFKKETGKLPVRIIFYRDGVSMGQFGTVLDSEFQAIRRACNKIQENYNPLITLIVVQKRHHTRLFPEDYRDTEDRNGNVPAGTCVDTDIVLPNHQNFYLVSHASIQGTARPTKYVTLSDDHGFSNDELQSLTYYLCHMYTRCTRSVSYPAPTYYAHLAALRGKAYIDLLRFDLNNLEREQKKFKVKEEIIKGLPMFFV